jgi:hypothetical protein
LFSARLLAQTFHALRVSQSDMTDSVETEHLLRFRLSGSHPVIRVHSFLKRNDLNRRRLQSSCFKTRAELLGDFRYLSRRQPITVYSKQPGEIVIEVVIATCHASNASDRNAGSNRGPTHSVKHSLNSSSRCQFHDPLTKILGLGIDHRHCTGNRIGCDRRANNALASNSQSVCLLVPPRPRRQQ